MLFKSLNEIERTSFRSHVIYNVAEGILTGFFLMNEFVFLKSLEGTDFQIGLLFLFSMAVFVPLIFFNEVLRRTQNKKKLIRYTAIITRLPLLLFFFFPKQINSENIVLYHYAFLGIFFIYYLGTPVIFPTINLLLKNAYKNNNFGKLFGYATSVNKTLALISTFAFGQLLNFDNYAFVYVYPVLGLVGIYGLFKLSVIPATIPVEEIKLRFFAAVKKSGLRLLNILKNDKPYLHYQISFFLYGIAFMITITVITFFLEKYLKLNYPSIANYKTIAAVITVLCLPLFGKILDKTDPRKFAAFSFSFFILYVFFILITQYLTQNTIIGNFQVYLTISLAFVFFGFFSASNTLAWHIGSAFFSKNDNEAADYQAIHVILTGVRGLFAPLAGVFLYQFYGYTITFTIAIIFLIFAIIIMIWSKRKY